MTELKKNFRKDQRSLFPVGLVIMASGMGKRFGSNKLLADFAGKPMIRWILEASDHLFAWRVVVTRHQEVKKICQEMGVPVVLHDLPGRNDSIRLGLQEVVRQAVIRETDVDSQSGQQWTAESGDTPVKSCIFVPADQPLLKRETLEKLAIASLKDSAHIYRTEFEGQMGAPTAFPPWYFEELLKLPEGKGGNVLLKKYPESVKSVQAGHAAELMDVDTPMDLDVLVKER